MLAAAFACPTRSIRPHGRRLEQDADPFPLRLDERVRLCGHNSPQTAGATAYLLSRPSGTLMMIDSPWFSDALASKYEALGQATDVLLTHRDHAAHGRRYADRFDTRLWVHKGDLDAAPDANRILRGTEPTEIADTVLAHPLPGHTKGSVLYLADARYCFSGDSIYYSRTHADQAVAESVTWYSVTVLAASLARAAPMLRFEWLLPGHGDRIRFPADEMTQRLRTLAAHVRTLQPRPVDFSAVHW